MGRGLKDGKQTFIYLIFLIFLGTAGTAQANSSHRCVSGVAEKAEKANNAQHYGEKGRYKDVYDKVLALLPMAQQIRQVYVSALAPLYEKSSSLKVLDLGFGTGRLGRTLKQAFGAEGVRLFGVEFHLAMAQQAFRNGYRPENTFIHDLKLTRWIDKVKEWAAKEKFDAITMNMVSYMLEIQHLETIAKVASLNLKPGGRIAFSILNAEVNIRPEYLDLLHQQLRKLKERGEIDQTAVDKTMEANEGLYDIANFFHIPQVRRIFEKYGLVMVEHGHGSQYGGTAEVLVFEKRY